MSDNFELNYEQVEAGQEPDSKSLLNDEYLQNGTDLIARSNGGVPSQFGDLELYDSKTDNGVDEDALENDPDKARKPDQPEEFDQLSDKDKEEMGEFILKNYWHLDVNGDGEISPDEANQCYRSMIETGEFPNGHMMEPDDFEMMGKIRTYKTQIAKESNDATGPEYNITFADAYALTQ